MLDKSLTFFRVFDIAFFAPGCILMVFARASGLWPKHLPDSLTSPEGVFCLVAGVAITYILGLIVHAVVWFVVSSFGKPSADGSDKPFASRFKKRTKDELLLYFWYLRATCWNVAAALVIGSVMWLAQPLDPRCRVALAGVAFLVAMAALVRQGNSFHRSLRREQG